MTDDSNWLPFLNELRKRVLFCSLLYAALVLLLYPFANFLYELIAFPLVASLPMNGQIIATQLTSTFIIPLKLVLFSSFVLMIPLIFYQIWKFISPALYSHEKKRFFVPLLIGIILFYLGMNFCFFLVLPFTLKFFTSIAPNNVTVMTDMGHYLDFILQLLIVFGFAFQIPLIVNVCIRNNIIKKEKIKKIRPYVVVMAFVLGMILTPPDVISQIMLAIPLWGLFEIGVWLTPGAKAI